MYDVPSKVIIPEPIVKVIPALLKENLKAMLIDTWILHHKAEITQCRLTPFVGVC